jgi:LPS-assembly lipoprotein
MRGSRMKKLSMLFLAAVVAGCGFEPLYVQKKSAGNWYFGGDFDVSITKEMALVKVEAIRDRFGQQVRNSLLDSLTPHGMPARPKYRLRVVVEDPEVILQALRADITATRERAKYFVRYMMYDKEGNELFRNDSVAYVSYDILSDPYSTTMAAKKAEENAAKIIADDISLRVGAYFHSVLQPGEAKE